MQALIWNPRAPTNCCCSWRRRSSLLNNICTSYSSFSSSNDNDIDIDVAYTNQSRGGLPRFYSQLLPSQVHPELNKLRILDELIT